MTKTSLAALTEDELDALVSIAIRRAEILDDMRSPAAADAWHEVMVYEERLAGITSPADVAGGIARVGAVRAALSAGRRQDAARLASRYRDEDALPPGRRAALERAFEEERERLARLFPALARSGRLAELDEWRAGVGRQPTVFPRAA